jgi:hypothetical protein
VAGPALKSSGFLAVVFHSAIAAFVLYWLALVSLVGLAIPNQLLGLHLTGNAESTEALVLMPVEGVLIGWFIGWLTPLRPYLCWLPCGLFGILNTLGSSGSNSRIIFDDLAGVDCDECTGLIFITLPFLFSAAASLGTIASRWFRFRRLGAANRGDPPT